MGEFDPLLWKDRAWERYKRSHNSGRPPHECEIEWAQNVLSISDLQKIIGWCTERKIKVSFVKKPNGTYSFMKKEIEISSKLSLKNQVIVLLHECGHHLIGVNEYHERFGMGYSQDDPDITKTFHHRVACLEEEMEAWYRGWKLAKRLNLAIERKDFDFYKVKCLRTYIKWTLRPGTFRLESE